MSSPALPTPAALLQELIRFDTTNPPGAEAACMRWIAGLLAEHGIEAELLGAEPARPNLLARIAGRGEAPPLLLYGHVDVVGVAGQTWSVDPFGGALRDGAIWGRGALDMKGGVAMLLAAFLELQASGEPPPGDVVLLVLADEEAGGTLGAVWLVEQHPDRLAGVRHALGEFGGFSMELGGRRFYPVQVAEKRFCTVRVRVRGTGGHGAMPRPGTALGRLGAMLALVDTTPLPIRITPPVEAMLGAMADAVEPPWSGQLRALLDPERAIAALAAMAPWDAFFGSLLRHTVVPTIVHVGEAFNVVPATAEATLDGRVLPGREDAELLADLAGLLGPEAELEVVRSEPVNTAATAAVLPLLVDVLRRADPDGIPVPLVLPGATDARTLDRLGIQTYGFLPLRLPPDTSFLGLVHGADERVPVAALDFGTAALGDAIRRYAG